MNQVSLTNLKTIQANRALVKPSSVAKIIPNQNILNNSLVQEFEILFKQRIVNYKKVLGRMLHVPVRVEKDK